ncbi:MAG: TRAM domain-containing protein, partial [Chloroflexi bacterium]|nr:TRAM domain-containing protein [Chloroflexota bacterium]
MATEPNGDEVTLVAEGMAFLGECIARHEGKVVFVPYLVPGERARIKLVTDKRGYA